MSKRKISRSNEHLVGLTTRELELVSKVLHKELFQVAGKVIGGQKELKGVYEELDALIDKLMACYFQMDMEGENEETP